MLGTPKALGADIEGKAVSRVKPAARETQREVLVETVKELWPTREK